MKKKDFFSIGEISKICNVSVSMLRHYDKVGVLKPAYIDKDSHYRFYDEDAIFRVAVLRYYQRIGFTLQEIPLLLGRENYDLLKTRFSEKISEIDEVIRIGRVCQITLDAWIELFDEASDVLSSSSNEIRLGKVEKLEMLHLKPHIYEFTKLKHLLANAEFGVANTSQKQLSHGPLYISYPSYQCRLNEEYNFGDVTLLIQRHPLNPPCNEVEIFGDFTAVMTYHKGSYNSLAQTYKSMEDWASKHNFCLKGNSIERYVTDYWSTDDEDQFVTEIFLPLK